MAESSFGVRLRELRTARGISQQAAAEACHCHDSRISRIEAGKVAPTLRDAEALDRLFGTTPELALLAERHRPQARKQPSQQDPPPPRNELPPPPTYLLGRDEAMSKIIEHLDRASEHIDSRAVRVCFVDGLPGFGKTALATYAADELRKQYGDGQLYLDLHGYTSARPTMSPAEALDTLLRRLNVPGSEIPANGVADLVVELRSRIGRRRFLVLIENAQDTTQLNTLVSALPGCAVIVTSRRRLSVDDACRIELTGLDEEHADQLFRVTSGIGEPVDTDDTTSAHVRSIVKLCYGNPLAIRIVASRCRDNPAVSLEHLAQALADARTRFAAIANGDRSLASALATSLALLAEPQREALTLLAVHPGVSFDPYSTGAMVGTAPSVAAELLDELFRAWMIEAHSVAAYHFHDLIRDFLRHGEPSARSSRTVGEALGRLFDYYLRTAADVYRTTEPHRHQLDVDLLPDPVAVRSFHSEGDAVRWLKSEQVNLLSVCRQMLASGFHETCWKFCYFLRGYFFSSRQWPSWGEVYAIGAEAARRAGDQRAEGTMLNNEGVALAAAGDPEGAAERHRLAMEAFSVVDDEHGVVTARAHLGWALHLMDQDAPAYALTTSALDFYRLHGKDWNVATTLESLAYITQARGMTLEAKGHLAEAYALFVDVLRLPDYARTMLAQFTELMGVGEALA